jgi:hypothetical protein
VGTVGGTSSTTTALPNNNVDDDESTDFVWAAGNARIIELSVGMTGDLRSCVRDRPIVCMCL